MRRLIILCVLLSASACADTRPAPSPGLYAQLGEQPGIERLVDEFVFRLANDARIARHFADTDLDRLREKLAEQFCVEAGGPCTYTGQSMRAVHTGMGVTAEDFNALVEDLQIAMEAQNVPQAAQNQLLRRLAPLRREIVE